MRPWDAREQEGNSSQKRQEGVGVKDEETKLDE